MDKLHLVVQKSLGSNQERVRNATTIGSSSHFMDGYFILVPLDDYSHGEKLSLRWRGPWNVKKVLPDYVYQVEDLKNSELSYI